MIKGTPNKVGGHEEKKIQRVQKIWAFQNKWYDNAQPNEKKKEKKLKPNTGGHDKPFWK